MNFLYFGCWSKENKGHYAWLYPDKICTYRDDVRGILPFKAFILDSLLKDTSSPQSRAQLSHIGNWTVITMGDYSADSRGGSTASFVAEGKYNLNEMVELAYKFFPEQITRIEAVAKILPL